MKQDKKSTSYETFEKDEAQYKPNQEGTRKNINEIKPKLKRSKIELPKKVEQKHKTKQIED